MCLLVLVMILGIFLLGIGITVAFLPEIIFVIGLIIVVKLILNFIGKNKRKGP